MSLAIAFNLGIICFISMYRICRRKPETAATPLQWYPSVFSADALGYDVNKHVY